MLGSPQGAGDLLKDSLLSRLLALERHSTERVTSVSQRDNDSMRL
jgi:hypothetical protein